MEKALCPFGVGRTPVPLWRERSQQPEPGCRGGVSCGKHGSPDGIVTNVSGSEFWGKGDIS